jgi:peptidoglycan/xylan/chitin deacetylase (PgdA/CDA1 family)
MHGIFTLSLDFELHWGVFDKRSREDRKHIYQNTLQLVPRLLELFHEYDVHVTWATVGSMFAKDKDQWNHLKPEIEPEYREQKYSAYRWVHQHDLPSEAQWAHFAPDMIRQILRYPGQELGTHTFSHFYCLEEQYQPDAFENDLHAAQRAAALFNTKLTSLVFPRNQFNAELLKVCYRNGITAVRSNPENWFWSPVKDRGSNIIRKLIRTSDAYIQLGGQRMSYPISKVVVNRGEPVQMPASRFFRPWRDKYQFANKLRLQRMAKEIRTAAKYGECYHLWFHPENFGEHPEQNMDNLRYILEEYSRCSNKYGMQSWNMSEYAHHLIGSPTSSDIIYNVQSVS